MFYPAKPPAQWPMVAVIYRLRVPGVDVQDDVGLSADRVRRGRVISRTSSTRKGALFPNPVVAESLLDRLINTSHQILINGTQTVLSRHWHRARVR
jgi:hypothetical protein